MKQVINNIIQNNDSQIKSFYFPNGTTRNTIFNYFRKILKGNVKKINIPCMAYFTRASEIIEICRIQDDGDNNIDTLDNGNGTAERFDSGDNSIIQGDFEGVFILPRGYLYTPTGY